MQNRRAMQFMPFDALKGFKEYLNIVESENETDLDKLLLKKIKSLKINDIVNISYFINEEFIETYGIVKKITNEYIVISNSKIYLKDIFKIN